MIDLKFINAKGNTLNLIGNLYFTIVDIDGLHGVDNDMATSSSPYFDGVYVDHISTLPRQITLTMKLHTPISESLNYFNSFCKSKQTGTLIETQEDGTQIKIDGIVTVPSYTRWTNRVAVQLQLYCAKPYWKDLTYIAGDIAQIVNMHYFPFEDVTALDNLDGGLALPVDGIPFGEIDLNATETFTNNGDITCGMQIDIVALGTVVNPQIANVNTNQFIGVDITLNSGDSLVINTERGNKYVTLNGTQIFNGINYSGNDWLQLETGENTFVINASSGSENVYFHIYYKREWQ